MEKKSDGDPGDPVSEQAVNAAARAVLLSFPLRQADEPCPGDEDFALFASAQLDAVERRRFLAHMDACPSCRQQLLRVLSAVEYAAAGQKGGAVDTPAPGADARRAEGQTSDDHTPPGPASPIPPVCGAAPAKMPSSVHRQARAIRSVWKKAAFACAAAACLLLMLNQGRLMTDAGDPLGELTAELAALPRTRGSSAPWLDASLQASADERVCSVYGGYAYESALLQNRDRADISVPSQAPDAKPYYSAGRLIFALEQFCGTEGEISRKHWESIRTYWPDHSFETPFSELQALFSENAPPGCRRLRPAIESLFRER